MFGWMEKSKRGAAYQPEYSGALGGVLITGNVGLVGGTRVASNLGWRAVEALCVGDKVLTFDHGMQTVVDIQRELFDHKLLPWQRPVHIPSEALQNRRDLWLMPDQGLLVECDAVMDSLGDPFAVVPAHTLDGFRNIECVATDCMFEATILAFERDEAIYVEGGMLAFCPKRRSFLGDELEEDEPLYDVLGNDHATALVQEMIAMEHGAGFACDPEEVEGIVAKRVRPGRPSPT